MINKDFLDSLDTNQVDVFLDGLKTYLGYEDEMRETKEAQKDQIKRVAQTLKFKAKDIRKYFVYFKKKISAEELREDAEIVEIVSDKLSQK